MLRLFPDHESLSAAAAELVLDSGRRAAAGRERFDLVLAGGRTPLRAYEILGARLASERALAAATHLWWSDERCVAADSPESNYGSAAGALIAPSGIPPAQVHAIEADAADADAAAERYCRIFPRRADLVLLGLGTDGHTASLFPGTPALLERKRPFVAAEAPVEPRGRITITPPALAAAREVAVLVSGPDKAAALARVFSEGERVSSVPARLVKGATWLVTRDAAEPLLRSGVLAGG